MDYREKYNTLEDVMELINEQGLNRYANGFKPKTVQSCVGELHFFRYGIVNFIRRAWKKG